MPVSKAQQKAVNGYIARNYDRINLTVPKGRKVIIEACARSEGTTINGLVNALLREKTGLTEDEWKGGGQNA